MKNIHNICTTRGISKAIKIWIVKFTLRKSERKNTDSIKMTKSEECYAYHI